MAALHRGIFSFEDVLRVRKGVPEALAAFVEGDGPEQARRAGEDEPGEPKSEGSIKNKVEPFVFSKLVNFCWRRRLAKTLLRRCVRQQGCLLQGCRACWGAEDGSARVLCTEAPAGAHADDACGAMQVKHADEAHRQHAQESTASA